MFNPFLYPPNWEEISHSIRFGRAGGQCEVLGHNNARCEARHGETHPITGSRVVLTTAHLENPHPMDVRPENLMAMCQGHHLSYDRERAKEDGEDRSKRRPWDLKYWADVSKRVGWDPRDVAYPTQPEVDKAVAEQNAKQLLIWNRFLKPAQNEDERQVIKAVLRGMAQLRRAN